MCYIDIGQKEKRKLFLPLFLVSLEILSCKLNCHFDPLPHDYIYMHCVSSFSLPRLFLFLSAHPPLSTTCTGHTINCRRGPRTCTCATASGGARTFCGVAWTGSWRRTARGRGRRGICRRPSVRANMWRRFSTRRSCGPAAAAG